MGADPSLDLFHPLIAGWFEDRLGTPTDVQAQAWPLIAAGEHVLVTAPTGSGKTLTALLWAIDRLVTGAWPTGQASVLYVSPLRALNNDIQRNLTTPLAELRRIFEAAGAEFPHIRALTRSGDTPQSERRRMLTRPPEILITTPESLNLLHSSGGGRSLLTGIRTVILDEIHAVVGTKRGTHLITAVDRLVPACGEFQRIALSATVRPLETVAEFVGGFRMENGGAAEPRYVARQVSILRSTAAKRYDVRVRFPEAAVNSAANGDSVWEPLVEEFRDIIDQHTSTLVFTNNRRLCEKLTLLINSAYDRPVAYAHHGSLSRELREEVERKLKEGALKAIVATSSLELGIDVGALDAVILVQSPLSVSSAIQRLGRAGHQVGEVSRGVLFPTYPQDFLESAVLSRGIMEQDIEAVRPVDGPLDVLAQVIISMVGVEAWDRDDLFHQLRTSYPYRGLSREQFQLVLNMLAGRYAHSRIRELRPKISLDGLDNSVAARKGALQALYLSGGTIPDRGYFHLRRADTNARIGELDEEFVWERSEGQTFALGTQNWTIQRITHNDVLVTPAAPKPVDLPFWKADGGNRDFHFSERIGQFLEEANQRLEDAQFATSLQQDRAMDAISADQLLSFLRQQKEVCRCDLPHRHHIVVERTSSGPDGYPGNQVILHTLWGGCVNRPYALALDAAWDERFGQRLEIYPSNDCIAVLLPHDVDGDELLAFVTSARFESLLRLRLEGSAFFGARFRECAQRALLLTRNRFNERMPLWMSRLRSQKLLDSVSRYEDFPVLLEAWRTCLRDEFDVTAARQLLAEMESGSIRWTEARTDQPSPFARGITWSQIDKYMYMDDESQGQGRSNLRSELLRDVVLTPGLRPTVEPELVRRFEEKRRRLSPGYAPPTARDLVDWVVERRLIPWPEWMLLLEAVRRDAEDEPEVLLAAAGDRLVRMSGGRLEEPIVAALESLPHLSRALDLDWSSLSVRSLGSGMEIEPPSTETSQDDEGEETLTDVLAECLRFYGPTSCERLRASLGLAVEATERAIDDLVETDQVVRGQLITESDEVLICDCQNLETLLRIARAAAVPVFEPLPIARLPLFLATWQGLTDTTQSDERLARSIEQLLCYEAPAAIWGSDIIPARFERFSPPQLDALMGESPLRWIGRGENRVAFCFAPDLDLLEEQNEECVTDCDDSATSAAASLEIANLFPDPQARYDFATLHRSSGLSATELSKRLWSAAWQGLVTNDTFSALSKGIETRFEIPGEQSPTGSRTGGLRPRRSGFSRWRGSIPYAGNWHLLPRPEPNEDLIEVEERGKDRARLLLERYGLLFRELLQRESPVLRWSSVFRSLRLMELSGEVLAGCFFDEIPGPQFISQRAFRVLQHQLPSEVFWLSAADPASPCGLQIPGLKEDLPTRIASNHLVYHGSQLVLVSRRNGRSLSIFAPASDPDLQRYVGQLRHLFTRQSHAGQLTVESINEEKGAHSDYVDVFRVCFDAHLSHNDLILCRRPAEV